MYRIIIEIINTHSIVIENNPVPDFPGVVRLRRTYTMFCMYCQSHWGSIDYDRISRSRVCQKCNNEIKGILSEKRRNLHLISETIKNKTRVLRDIVEVGMNPDRVYQTQLVETLYLFRQPDV